MIRIALVAIVLLATATASAAERLAGPIAVDVVRVTDGDTLVVEAQIWLDLVLTVRVRLAGIDAPEIKGKCDSERHAARESMARLTELAGRRVTLTDVRHDKYAGRALARVANAEGRDLAAALIAEGKGRPYAGVARMPWC